MGNFTNREEKARENFKKGYNCCQSVVLAFSDLLPVDDKTAALISSSFGGGMGRLREVCGAVSGMFMVEGMVSGYSEPEDKSGKIEHYSDIQALAKAFTEENGDIVCKNLLGLPGAQKPMPAERDGEYYKKRPCVDLVGSAARILEEKLKDEGILK